MEIEVHALVGRYVGRYPLRKMPIGNVRGHVERTAEQKVVFDCHERSVRAIRASGQSLNPTVKRVLDAREQWLSNLESPTDLNELVSKQPKSGARWTGHWTVESRGVEPIPPGKITIYAVVGRKCNSVFVGRTYLNVYRRFQLHTRPGDKLCQAIQAMGTLSFVVVSLETARGDSLEELQSPRVIEREQFWVNILDGAVPVDLVGSGLNFGVDAPS